MDANIRLISAREATRGEQQNLRMNLDKVMTMKPTPSHDSDDMPIEIDFSGGERGKLYRKNARFQPDQL